MLARSTVMTGLDNPFHVESAHIMLSLSNVSQHWSNSTELNSD